ncbi:2-iminobutanoate/2-iminopropanoate deaminase [Chitinophaga filiformis]|uniref:2-iminobutanoate/2-iminopropanoate deaminase n=2 Tax=Chitinophaga filiformis TaxID=104663 RepID=A0A1G8ADU1_CHIFI|nr:2-iminobutanoate/2-iminopropanoate deaminase [Chitinophaga filiformis]
MSLLAITVHGQTKPFSRYREHNGLVFVSGQIGVTSKDHQGVGFNEEVNQALKNVSAILKEAGTSLSQVVSVTVHLRNLSQFEEFNSIYKQYFHPPYPARTCVTVSDLVNNANIEISVIAGK